MNKTTNIELLEQKITKLIQSVEDAGSWKKPFQSAMASGLPKNHYSDKLYKGANIFFLWMEAIEKGYQSNNWITMKQCNQLKGKVHKGERSTIIFFFKPIEVEELDESTSAMKTVKIPMLKTYRVFNIDQTTLKPDEIATDTIVSPIDECEEFFNSLDICEIKEGGTPYYHTKLDYISIPSINKFIDAPSYYATLAHEYIHSTGHSSRLGRDMDNKRDKYAYEELIAEIGASFVSAHLGIDADDIQDNAKAYLKTWLQSLKDDHKYLWKAMSEASRAFEYILDSTAVTTGILAA